MPITPPPPPADVVRQNITQATEKFLNTHQLRLKIRRLPMMSEEVNDINGSGGRNAPSTSANGSYQHANHPSTTVQSKHLPAYHFVNRQKRHLAEQLLRNRSSYQTEFNNSENDRNRLTPFVLKDMPTVVREHLTKMANDFDDPEFSGVWLSLHSPPFKSKSDYGDLTRSKIVGWALIEVLTTNERCLKALWIHPDLSAIATSNLLKGFLPRVIYEAFEFSSPQGYDNSQGKFFYSWLNDFDLLPRPCWLLLCGDMFFGLPKHFDVLADATGAAPGHSDDGDPPGSACPCQKNFAWDEWEQMLVGCTESYMYRHIDKWIDMIPKVPCERLLDVTQALSHDEMQEHIKLPSETVKEVVSAEFLSLPRSTVVSFLGKVYGKWGKERIRTVEEDVKSGFDETSKRKLNVYDNKINAKRERSGVA